MKISNKLFSEQQVSQFSKQMENVQKIQSKISTGKKENKNEIDHFQKNYVSLGWDEKNKKFFTTSK